MKMNIWNESLILILLIIITLMDVSLFTKIFVIKRDS